MRSSPLSDLYAACVAEQLPVATRRVHHVTLATALDGLLAGPARRTWLTRVQSLCGDDSTGEPLDALMRELVARLRIEPSASSELPAWVRLAQQSREVIPFDRLGEVVDISLSEVAGALPAATRAYVQTYLWEAGEAAEVFRQRFQVGVDRDAIAAEVCTDLAATAAAFDDIVQPGDVDALAAALAELLGEWSQCSADMGPVVELELIRQFARMVLPRFDFSARLWSLVVLRLDHALGQRAASPLHNPLADATDVLLAACPRYAFLKQALTDVVLYLPPDAELWADLLALETLLAAVPESRLQRWRLWNLRTTRLLECFGSQRDALEPAMKLHVQSMRQQWERHELDGFVDAGQRLLQWLDAGSTVAALDLDGLEAAAIWPAVHATQVTDELPVREAVYRMLALQTAGGADLAQLPAAVADGAGALLEQLPGFADSVTDRADAGSLQSWMQRLGLLHRLLPPVLAKAEARVALARRWLDGSLPADIDAPALAVAWEAQVGDAGERWASLLLRVRTAARLIEVGAEVAGQTTGDVFDSYPEYSHGSGRAACIRDNSFTLLRVAKSLVRDGELAPLAVANWWARTIGAYLRSRTPAVMIFNLGALFDRAGAAMGPDGLALLRNILMPVYRRSFGIELPRELAEHDRPALMPVGTAGALWRQVVGSARPLAPHHGQGLALPPLSGADDMVQSLWAAWQQAFASHGDPVLAWRDTARQLSGALGLYAQSELRAAWLRQLAAGYASWPVTLAAFRQLLLAQGLPALAAVSLGHALGARRAAVLGESGLPRALVRSWDAVLEQLQQGLQSGSVALALLNGGRMMLSRVGLAPKQSRTSWPLLTARLSTQLCDGEGGEVPAFLRGLTAVGAGMAGLEALCEQLLWEPTAQFSENVEAERGWRELVAGLAVCVLLTAAEPELGRSALTELAMGSEGFADPVNDWSSEQLVALDEFLRPMLDSALHPALAQTLGQLREVVEAAGVLLKSPGSTGLDAVIALRRHRPEVLGWWRGDRLVRVELEQLTTPLPGDLTLASALRSSALDMVTLRSARSLFRDAVEYAPLEGVSAAILALNLGLRRAALSLAFLREGSELARVGSLLVSLAQSEWADLDAEGLPAQLRTVLQTLNDEGLGDSGWTPWVVELLRQLRPVNESAGEAI